MLKITLPMILVVVSACTSPNPDYCPDHDCLDSRTTIQVAVTGDDTADGIAAPVKTLKHAVELATTNSVIKGIHVGAGEYNADNGDTFNYYVPPHLRIEGEDETVLIGSGDQFGLLVSAARIEGLEFRNFATAIRVAGEATLAHITVQTSPVGVLADNGARLSVNALKYSGNGGCADVGLRVGGDAKVNVDDFEAKRGTAIEARDTSEVAVQKGDFAATGCTLVAAGGKSLALTDTTMTDAKIGLQLGGSNVEVTLLNARITAMTRFGINGSSRQFQMKGGALERNLLGGAYLEGGTSYSFTDATITGNDQFGIYVAAFSSAPAFAMHGCTVTANETGVWIVGPVRANLGTWEQPGNNKFLSNRRVGLYLINTGVGVMASGNRWNPGSQCAGSDGTCPPSRAMGPQRGGNYELDRSTLQL